MSEFVTFAVRLDIDLDDFDSCPKTAAAVSASFVQFCHDNAVPFWIAKYCLLAIQTRWRQLRGKLGRG